MDGSVGIVLPAAGSGERLGGRRKQLRSLGGRPLWIRTLDRLRPVSGVGPCVVVVDSELADSMRESLRTHRPPAENAGLAEVRLVPGGESRRASVEAGVRALVGLETPPEQILVHDAVRPFVAPGRIEAVIDAIRVHGAAALGIPAADTLRRREDGVYGATVSREGIYRMQTPQGARTAWLVEAFEGEETAATDEVELLQRAGRPVQIVRGDPMNFKITTPADWELAEMLWTLSAKKEER